MLTEIWDRTRPVLFANVTTRWGFGDTLAPFHQAWTATTIDELLSLPFGFVQPLSFLLMM
jgi:hypothetical protein